jgi:hypothetical protein
VSYSNELAIKHAIDFRAVIGSGWYRGVFPKTMISREKDRNHRHSRDRRFSTRRRLAGLELGKGQQDVEGQSTHRGRGIELLGDRDDEITCFFVIEAVGGAEDAVRNGLKGMRVLASSPSIASWITSCIDGIECLNCGLQQLAQSPASSDKTPHDYKDLTRSIWLISLVRQEGLGANRAGKLGMLVEPRFVRKHRLHGRRDEPTCVCFDARGINVFDRSPASLFPVPRACKVLQPKA